VLHAVGQENEASYIDCDREEDEEGALVGEELTGGGEGERVLDVEEYAGDETVLLTTGGGLALFVRSLLG